MEIELSHEELHARLTHAEKLIEFWRHPDDGADIGIEGLYEALRAVHIDLRDRVGQLQERVVALTTAQEQLNADAATESAALDTANATISDLATHVGNLISEIAALKSQIAGGLPAQSLDFTAINTAGAKAQATLVALQAVDTTATAGDTPPSADTGTTTPPADDSGTTTPPADAPTADASADQAPTA